MMYLKCVCYLTGFFDGAKSDFQQALKLNPDFEDAQVSLRQTLLDQQQKLDREYWWRQSSTYTADTQAPLVLSDHRNNAWKI